MAIGLSDVNKRKVKRNDKTTGANEDSQQASFAAQAAEGRLGHSEAWSARGLAREGRSVRRERAVASGDLNTLWYEWTGRVAGSENPNRLLRFVQKWLDLEVMTFDFLVHELQLPARLSKKILRMAPVQQTLKLKAALKI